MTITTIHIREDGQSAYGSRYSGNRIRQQVADAIEAGQEKVTLDFAGVEFVGPGFVDELLGVLVYHCGKEWFDRHLGWVNAEPEVEDEIHEIINYRNDLREQRLAAAA